MLLFEILRQKRKELADAAHVPPYVVFPDKTLIEMATYYPVSTESMKKIYGVGSSKLAKYGQIFSDLIASYCKEKHLSENRNPETNSVKAKQSDQQLLMHNQIGEAYNNGATIQELMDHFGVQQGTIFNHLSKYIQQGNSLRSDEFLALPDLPEELSQRVMRAFELLGTEYLKPVFEEFGGAVDYDDLKTLRLYYLVKQNDNLTSGVNKGG